MKRDRIFRAFALFFLSAGLLWADTPGLEQGVDLKDGSGDLKVSDYSSPTMVDWNNDGTKDLLVGQRVNGYVWLFLNSGTDMNPIFQGSTQIESNGSPILTGYS